MARVAPAVCSFWAMPQAMERLLASPKTTAVLPAKSIMLVVFLQCLHSVWEVERQPSSRISAVTLESAAVAGTPGFLCFNSFGASAPECMDGSSTGDRLTPVPGPHRNEKFLTGFDRNALAIDSHRITALHDDKVFIVGMRM